MGDFGHHAMMRGGDVQGRGKGNRNNIQTLKMMGQSHPTGLTASLLKLFEPRPPLEYKPPIEKRKMPAYTGMAQFVSQFAEPGDKEYAPPVPKVETRAEKKARIRESRLEKGAEKAAEELQKYDPNNDPNVTGDPYKTLFVARLHYETTEHRLKREFETYGPIKRVRLVNDKVKNKPRGYAFIEYAHTRDMKTAYKQADGKKVENRRVLVDVERGRTVPNWRPRRLGGGLGSSRIGGEVAGQKHSAREVQQVASVRPRSEEPRKDDRHADRDREKSRERVRERDPDKEKSRDRERERSHERVRDRDGREDRHHRDRDRNRGDKDRERDRDRESRRDRGRDRDRERGDGGRDHDRERGDRDRDHDRHRDKRGDRERDYERVSHERDRGHKDAAEYENGEPKHERNNNNMAAEYEPEWNNGSKHGHNYEGYEQYEPQNHYAQDGHGHGHDKERSRRREHEYYPEDVDALDKMETDYNPQSKPAVPDAPEEGEAYDDRDYDYSRAADEYRK